MLDAALLRSGVAIFLTQRYAEIYSEMFYIDLPHIRKARYLGRYDIETSAGGVI